MRVRDAANAARVFVIMHLMIALVAAAFQLVQMGRALGMRAEVLQVLVMTGVYVFNTILLDVGLLILIGALARTREQQMRDWEDAQDGPWQQ